MITSKWLAQATAALNSVGVPSSRLDAELLLAHALKKPYEYIFTHPEQKLSDKHSLGRLDELLERRMKREPMAYILGHKEFYGRLFKVTPDVLIPRPESETIIDLLKEFSLPLQSTFIDIGTGSGALAVTAKLEIPFLHVVATDISLSALKVAMKNAALLDAAIVFKVSNLLDSPQLPRADCIVANLPYVGEDWEVSPETKYEPAGALYGGGDGLFFIKKLIIQAPKILISEGYLALEADPRQHNSIVEFSKRQGFRFKKVSGFIIILQKRYV